MVAHGRSDDDFYAADELKYHGPNRWKSSFGKYFFLKKCVDVLYVIVYAYFCLQRSLALPPPPSSPASPCWPPRW